MVNFLTDPGRRVPPSLAGVRKATSEVTLEGVEGLERVGIEADAGLNGDNASLAMEGGTLVRFVLFDSNGGLNGFWLTGRMKVVFRGEICRDVGFGDTGVSLGPNSGFGGVTGRGGEATSG